MRHLDEGTIHAWLDGALDADEAARVEAHVAACTVCADAVAEARGLIAASSRILVALDNVPNIKGAKGAKGAGGAGWGRRSVATWLVRERIAAVVALIVAGGAVATFASRDTSQRESVQGVATPVAAVELAAADSPALPPPLVASAEARKEGQPPRDRPPGARAAGKGPARDLAALADSAPLPMPAGVAQVVPTDVAAASALRTDDTLRAVAMAEAQRAEAPQSSAETKSSVSQKVADALPRARAATDAGARRFADPRVSEIVVTGAAAGAGDRRLVQEERMTESGREVRRRIYRIDGILVTLDERLPMGVEEQARAPSANAMAAATPAPGPPTPRADTTAQPTNTIRWTDARGAEFTLTGPASAARLERIRKLLGY